MYYIAICLLITSYFYINNKYLLVDSKLRFLLYIPPAYIYWFVLAFQYNLGADYFSYIDIAENGIRGYIQRNNEVGFIFIVRLINLLSLPPQSLFAIIGFIHTVLAFVLFDKLLKYKFKIWLIFFIFFVVSTIYHNQLNGLRQFVAILSTPIFLLLVFEKKYFKALIVALLALSFHNSFLLVLLLLPVFLFFKNSSKQTFFVIFLIMPLIYLLAFDLVLDSVVKYIFPNYAHYLQSENQLSFTKIIPKVYFIPLFVYFWYIYLNDKRSLWSESSIFNFLILVFAITYCAYLTDVTFNFYGRFFQYFIIFYIFPIYYLFYHMKKKKNIFASLMLFMYIFAPYLLKTVLFPVGEYRFETIILY